MSNQPVPFESDMPLPPEQPLPEVISPDASTEHLRMGLSRKALVGATLGGMYAWSHVNYLAEIAAGETIVHAGANPWIVAAGVAAVASSESLGMSYVATKGLGDFTITPTNRVAKTLAASAVLSPIQSLWSGAPAGVMTDQMFGRDVTLPRRLVHAVPYGLAVGAWVTPNPISETVTGAVSDVLHVGAHEAIDHPGPSAMIGAVVLAAAAVKLKYSRKKSRSAETKEDA